jgi:hypothetical protein
MEQYLPGPYNDRSRTFIPSNGPIFNPLLKMRLVYIGFRGETTTPAMVARVFRFWVQHGPSFGISNYSIFGAAGMAEQRVPGSFAGT